MEYKELEDTIRDEAAKISEEKNNWTAAEVSHKLEQIADLLAAINRGRQGGIDASMGKRSGNPPLEI